ncbi:MAG TPA: hypothetical protein VNN73_22655 [Blastocatellia bacterium]|nr:hypothetical protein [Blastocatellia bacterium]
MKRILIVVAALILVVAAFAGNSGSQKPSSVEDRRLSGPEESFSADRWEYLVVAGANSNLTPSGNPRLRKDESQAFSREAFVLEQNLDKLGAKGWELVSVSGSPADPIYYFKRRK